MKDKVLALAEELDGVSFKENCDQCLACGTALCRGDLECAESVHKACAKRLREIVEHDACDDATVSAYDLLPEEDREALAWVREMGGVNALSMGFQDADNRRIELCSSLGIDLETGWADAMVAMRRRLMPEGMEWPKVNGKPVDFKTCYAPSVGALEAVSIYNNMACKVMGHDGIIKPASEIHAVVLAADGEPLEVGQTVYGTRDQTPVEVIATHSHEYDGIRTVKCKDANGCLFYCPEDLTHTKPEPPDTWERIEEDAGKNPFDYCKDVGHRLDTCENAERFKSRDLVRRRCRAGGEGRVMAEVVFDMNADTGDVCVKERVVRCRACRHFSAYESCDVGWCSGWECLTRADGFCHLGKDEL